MSENRVNAKVLRVNDATDALVRAYAAKHKVSANEAAIRLIGRAAEAPTGAGAQALMRLKTRAEEEHDNARAACEVVKSELVAERAAHESTLAKLDAEVEGAQQGMNYMMRTLAEAIIEVSEEPEIHADKLAKQGARLIKARPVEAGAQAPALPAALTEQLDARAKAKGTTREETMAAVLDVGLRRLAALEKDAAKRKAKP